MPFSTEQKMGYTVYALVYQAGIANVFECRTANFGTFGRDAKRLMQSDFRTCETFIRGILAGNDKSLAFTAYCNKAGDIAEHNWNEHLEDAPFSDKFRPIFKGYKPLHTLKVQHD